MNGLLAVARLADDKRLATMSIFLIDCATMISMIRHWLVGGAIFIISCGNSDGTPQGSGSGSGGSPTATAGTTTCSGTVAGVPLFVASNTPGKGLFYVATLSNIVYALEETVGNVVWSHSIGTGGHGIISSPVIDLGTRAIFVAADAGGHHQI